jgi:Fe-S cluster biogenesis protein NfuA
MGSQEASVATPTAEQIEEVLDGIRPALQGDGGDVEFVELKDGVVSLRLTGACGSCPSSTYTLKLGIERALMQKLPGIKEVEQVF